MPLVVLGLIALVAALLLIYSSRKSGTGSRAARRVQSTVVPEKRYEKSEDGKVVYLFGNHGDSGDDEDVKDVGRSGGAGTAGDTGSVVMSVAEEDVRCATMSAGGIAAEPMDATVFGTDDAGEVASASEVGDPGMESSPVDLDEKDEEKE